MYFVLDFVLSFNLESTKKNKNTNEQKLNNINVTVYLYIYILEIVNLQNAKKN